MANRSLPEFSTLRLREIVKKNGREGAFRICAVLPSSLGTLFMFYIILYIYIYYIYKYVYKHF